MSDANDVARQIVAIGCDPNWPDESVTISPLRLQKLLYYSQGWSLALLDRFLFADPIEAWQFGPVVPAVYQQFAGRSSGLALGDFAPPSSGLDPIVTRLLDAVWREYAQFTPGQLVTMTHSEAPWREAWESGMRSRITHEAMAKFFRGEMRRRTPKGWPSPAEVWQADAEADRGGWVDGKTFFEKLLAEL